MGRHKSRYNDNRHRSKRKKRHSSRSSSSDKETRRKDERFDRFERIVESLDRRSHVRGSCIHKGDEQMIPTCNRPIQRRAGNRKMDRASKMSTTWPQYNWDDRAIMRLIPGRLKGHARPRLAVTKESLKQHFRKSVLFSKFFKEAVLYEDAPSQALEDYCFQKLNTMRKLDQETR